MAPKNSSSKPPTGKPGGKTKKKQPLSSQDRLKRLFNSLCAQIDGGHFTNAIKTCDKILRVEPGDADATQTKIFLLLQTEQYQPALSLLENKSEYTFERAYLLYRLQREAEANEILDGISIDGNGEDRGVLHLRAQMNYRQGNYQAAFDMYTQLIDTSEVQSEEHADIFTNLQASQKQMEFVDTDFLRALDALPTSISAALESSPPPPQPLSSITIATALGTSTNVSGDSPSDPTKNTKKVRMRRVPTGVVPGVTPPPDPERWLKKSERSISSFGGKKRKGGGAGGGGATQGSVESNTTSHAPVAKAVGGTHGKGKKKR